MPASTRSSRASCAVRRALALCGLGSLACASVPLAPPIQPASVVVGVLSNDGDGELSFGAAFHQGAHGRYARWHGDLRAKGFPACFDSPHLGCLEHSRRARGADTAHVLVVEGHGDADQFQADQPVKVAGLRGLGRQDLDGDSLLRYLWLASCNVLAHGPTCDGTCPWQKAIATPSGGCHPHSTPACYQSGLSQHNAVERWRPVLAGSGLRMVCGGVTTVQGTADEADAMWEYLGNDMPPADAFILGALVKTATPDVPACLARGGPDPAASPLYDPTFTTEPNALAGDWYHLQYPVWAAPGAPPPAPEDLPQVIPVLRPRSDEVAADGGDVGVCGVVQLPAATSAHAVAESGRFDEALVLGRSDEHLSRRPRLIDVYIDTYCGEAACREQAVSPGTRTARRRGGYAIFDRVVRVCLKGGKGAECPSSQPSPEPSPSPSPEAVHEHGSAKAPPAEVAAGDAQIVEHEIPELGAGGRVVAQIDAQGAVTRVWRHLPPVSGPWRPRADERVVQPRDARERAAVELRARLGRGEVAADPRLETWGFRDVGGELRPFYVFEYLVTSRAGGERVLRIEVAALLRGAGGRRDAHAH